jgi:hypothetical protein
MIIPGLYGRLDSTKEEKLLIEATVRDPWFGLGARVLSLSGMERRTVLFTAHVPSHNV